MSHRLWTIRVTRVGCVAGLAQASNLRGTMDQTACKPGSVPPANGHWRSFLWTAHRWTVLATYPGVSGLRQPYRRTGATPLFGLAPGGACHAVPIAGSAVRSYRTLSPLPAPKLRRSALCGAVPRVTPGGRYPPPCRRGARTFLACRNRRDRPAIWSARLMGREGLWVNPTDARRRAGPSNAPSIGRGRAGCPPGKSRAAPAGRRSAHFRVSPWPRRGAGRDR